MISTRYKGYMEGTDLTRVPLDYLAYQSKNVICHKGVAYTRPGIKNDGTEPTGTDDSEINGEHVFKSALGGAKAMRATRDGRLQIKYGGLWITIFSGLTVGAEAVRFSEWIDDNGLIIKKRVFIVDGSDKIYEWNGALAVVVSHSTSHITVAAGSGGAATIASLGFDPGNVTPQAVRLIHLTAGVVTGSQTLNNSDDGSDLIFDLDATPSPIAATGDIVVGGVITHSDVLAGIAKDDIYTYKNRVTLGALDSIRVYFSDVEVKLNFTVPAVADRTATSPFFIDLNGNYTAMISRLNQSTQESTLWISTADDWMKVNALLEQDVYGNWVSTQLVSQAERTGSLPYAVADYKGDIIYFAQDRTLQRVTSVDVLGRDDFQLLSDEVEGAFERLDVTKLRVYYRSRYIFVLFPAESVTMMLDMVEKHFQPPQTLPMGLMSNIEGIEYGHSSVKDETFRLFYGRNDLGAKIESKFAFGYYQGEEGQEFRSKSHTMMGVSGRMTESAKATVEEFYEQDGAKAKETFLIDGTKVKLYDVGEDASWGARPWGFGSYGGGDTVGTGIKRVIAYDKYQATAWFDFGVVITVTGDEQEFHLLGWYIDDAMAPRKIPEELFIPKKTV